MADLAMSDGIAYLASDEGLFTVTLRGETFGTVNRSDETQRSLDDVAVARSCVVALDGGGSGPDSLVVYQLTHADVPEWMASLHLVTTGVALLAECDHAYVATGRSTLQVIDVSNPRQPSYTTEVVLPATVIDWVLSDHTIYATSRDGMVFNIDISRFWAPEVIDSLVVPNASSFDRDGILSVDGRRLLVANRSRGFARIEIGGAGELTLTEIIEDQVGYVGSILLDNEIVYVRGTPLSVFAFGDGGVLERLEALRLGHAHGAIVRDENLIALLDAKNPPGTRASLVVLPRQCSSELQ
jgi:hypothetical protein